MTEKAKLGTARGSSDALRAQCIRCDAAAWSKPATFAWALAKIGLASTPGQGRETRIEIQAKNSLLDHWTLRERAGMGGVDNIRGVAYQQAQAVLVALDVLDGSHLGGIRIEGVEDIVDIETFTHAGVVSSAKQVKTRVDRYTWGRAELVSVLNTWAALPMASLASFEFVTDGRLGTTGEEVQSALEQAGAGSCARLAEILEVDVGSPTCVALRGARVRVDGATTGSLLDRAERQVAAMLPSVRTSEDAREQARSAVGNLFRLLFERGGNPNESVRTFAREDLAQALGVPSDQPAAHRWLGALRPRYLRAARSIPTAPIALGVQVARAPHGASAEQLGIGVLLSANKPVLLFGRTGSGKTTAIRGLCREAADADRVVLLAHAEAYLGGRLDALVADAISNLLDEDLPAAAGRQALSDRSVVLAIDGVSEVPPHVQRALRDDLAATAAAKRGARIILIGRDIAVLREVLPSSVSPGAYYVSALGHEQRRAWAARYSHLDAERLVAQIEHALGDGAGNPLLFEMALELAVEGTAVTDRAALYNLFVERLAERSGATNLVTTSVALGMVFAQLLDHGRRYADPSEWNHKLHGAISTLAREGHPGIDADATDRSARRCGLIVPVGYTQIVRPLHDSFADYLAGTAHARGLVPFPPQLLPGDEQRILFSAEIDGLGSDLAHSVARSLPFLAVRASSFERASCFGENCPAEVEEFLRCFLAPGNRFSVALCRVGSRVMAARHTGVHSEWVDQHAFKTISRHASTIVLDSGGPLALAVRLWRHHLGQALRKPGGIQPSRPKSLGEACATLDTHLRRVAEAITQWIEQLAPPGHAAVLRRQVGPVGLRAVLLPEDNGDWPVIYFSSEDVNVSAADAADAPQHDVIEAGHIRLSVLLDTSAADAAAAEIRRAICGLTLFGWF
ncbi:MAG: ATP-binding protein [Pseudomonadota bacterium]